MSDDEIDAEILFISTTVDSIKEARSIARLLVEERLCACVQIDQVRSIYNWDDEISEELESRLTIKTVVENAKKDATFQKHATYKFVAR